MARLKVKKYTRANWTDFAHTGPGTLAGRYMRLFWHPVYRAQDLARGQTKPMRIMSEDFTLYRGSSGTPYAVAFRCAHRGTQLSIGSVEGENLRCFYHGWMYDGSGQCVEQPAEPKPFCETVRIRSFPTKEYLALIWVYLGEGEPPPFRRYPEFEEGDFDVVIYPTAPCNFFNRMENAVDESHLRFVHTTLGLGGCPRIEAKETSCGIATKSVWPNGYVNGAHYQVPNASEFKAHDFEKIAWRLPVDDEHYMSFNVEPTGKVRRSGDVTPAIELGEKILAGELRVEELGDIRNLFEVQDYVAQVGQSVIADRVHDRLAATDVGVFLLRKIWERELRALAEDRPLKQWRRPERLIYPKEPGWDTIE